MRKFLLVALVSLTLAANSPWDVDGRAWWDNVAYLASDEMQGRSIGSSGFNRAADFVAEQYERAGLRAAGNDGYFQRVWFIETSLSYAHVQLWRSDAWSGVSIPGDAEVNFTANSPKTIEARIVFAGYGLRIPEANYDDLRDLPLKGAIVAYVTGGPCNISGNLKSHYSSNEVRWRALKAAGAVGMIAIPNPKNMEVPWTRMEAVWGTPHLSLLEPKMDDFGGMQFNATWNPAKANQLLAGTGHTIETILDAADNQNELPRFATKVVLRGDIQVKSHLLSSKNVVAVHAGSDESLRNEYVTISAHLDHLGMLRLNHGDGIYNGAMDNAAGVASLIEIAKRLKHVATKRSILFVALTGEELGELGSAFFVRYPTVKGHLVADLNMDMFLPLFPLRRLEVEGLDESTLGSDVKSVADAAGIYVQTDTDPASNRFIRSDQYSFVKAGIPALAFKFGYQKGDPEEKVMKNWYATRYHSVTDDINQPVDFEAAAQFNDVMRTLLIQVADADESPAWYGDSFFKRFTNAGM